MTQLEFKHKTQLERKMMSRKRRLYTVFKVKTWCLTVNMFFLGTLQDKLMGVQIMTIYHFVGIKGQGWVHLLKSCMIKVSKCKAAMWINISLHKSIRRKANSDYDFSADNIQEGLTLLLGMHSQIHMKKLSVHWSLGFRWFDIINF